MNETVKKIIKMFDKHLVLSILESPNNYIVSICDKDADLDSVTDSIYAVDKKTAKVSEFSYFSKPEEYKEALKNVLYKYDENAASEDELAHWGIVGMKWGVRRYQNKDGSLTSAGKKRRARLEADLKEREKSIKRREREKAANDKLAAKSAELDERERALRGEGKTRRPNTSPERKKTASEMSDDELRERTNRMMMEAQYYNAQKNLAALNPPKVSAGQKFVTSLLNDVIAPAAKNAGRAWAENFMKEKLGLNKKAEKSIDEKLKEAQLKLSKKNEKLEDIRREIATREAQAKLDKILEWERQNKK